MNVLLLLKLLQKKFKNHCLKLIRQKYNVSEFTWYLFLFELIVARQQRTSLKSFDVASKHGKKELGVRTQVLPRFELGSLDSKSRVLTITP